MSKKLTAEALLEVFPSVLAADKDLYALAAAISEELEALYLKNDLLAIYTNISALPEALLDILAKDFKVDWYLSDAPIETKKAQILSCFAVHRQLGTKAAVVSVLQSIFKDAKIEEWFEYGGPPYSFRLEVTVSENGISAEQQQRALEKIKYYKNVRSWLERVNYTCESTGKLRTGAYAAAMSYVEIWPELVERLDASAALSVGGAVGMGGRLEIYPAACDR